MAQRDWVLDHLERYVESDGADGHVWHGRNGDQELTTLILTTTGRRSGAKQPTPLIYGTDGDDHVIVASRGGAEKHPWWYENLVADPAVDLQVAADKFPARARTATGGERRRLWDMMAAIFPSYTDYQERALAHREIPVVVMERR